MATKKQPPPTKKISKRIQSNLLLAQDPTTSAAVLEKLSLSTNDAVRRAVTANPNTPGRVLLRLSKFCFNAFAHNPALPILMLDDPTFFDNIPEHTAKRLVDLKDLPESLLLALAGSPREEIRSRIASHPNLPASCLAELLFDEEYLVRMKARSNPSLPDDALALFSSFGMDESGARTGEPSDISEEALSAVASKGVWGKTLVARYPKTPPALLESIFMQVEPKESRQSRFNGDWYTTQRWFDNLLSALLRHPNMPQSVVEGALHSGSYDIFREAASNPRVPTSLIEPLLGRFHGHHIQAMLFRKDFSAEALSLIIEQSKNDSLGTQDLWNYPGLLPRHLTQLAGSGDVFVRRKVALHPKTPSETRQELIKDRDPEVRRAALSLA